MLIDMRNKETTVNNDEGTRNAWRKRSMRREEVREEKRRCGGMRNRGERTRRGGVMVAGLTSTASVWEW